MTDLDTPWTTTAERWRQLYLWRNDWARPALGYVVSDLGRVGRVGVETGQGRRQTGDYLLSPTWANGSAYIDIAGRRWTVARLVAYAFLGTPPIPSAVIGFRDGDHENFKPDNLEWRQRVVQVHRRGRNWSFECLKTYPPNASSCVTAAPTGP